MLRPNGTDWQNGLQKKDLYVCVLFIRVPLHIQGYKQTESEMEKGFQ